MTSLDFYGGVANTAAAFYVELGQPRLSTQAQVLYRSCSHLPLCAYSCVCGFARLLRAVLVRILALGIGVVIVLVFAIACYRSGTYYRLCICVVIVVIGAAAVVVMVAAWVVVGAVALSMFALKCLLTLSLIWRVLSLLLLRDLVVCNLRELTPSQVATDSTLMRRITVAPDMATLGATRARA